MARFLLLTHIYPPAIDGGSKIINKIGDYLTSKKHQTLIITSNCNSSDDFSKFRYKKIIHSKEVLSIPVITVFHRPFKFISRYIPFFKVFSKGPIFDLIPFIKSLILVIKFHPDFIIAGPMPTTIIVYAKIFQFFSASKLVIVPCFHPMDPDFQSPLLISCLKKSDYIWYLTNYEKEYFQKNLNINYSKYIVYGLGVDSDFIISPKDIKYPKNPHIIFIANFSAHKRSELLISAFKKVLSIYPKATLTLLGQKTLYFPVITKYLESLDKNTKKHIHFIFKPSLSEIKSAIDHSSCLVLPSVHESFGLVFVESLARGKMVIGADTPQSTEVIKTLGGGFTFKTDNVDSLYKTIIKLIKNPSLTSKFAMIGYQNVKSIYTWDKIGENLCKKLGI